MKTEVGSFTPSTVGVTVVLDDDTLQVSGVLFQICKTGNNVNASTGFDDGVKHHAKYCLDDTIKSSDRTTAYSMYTKKNVSGTATVAVAGKIDTNGLDNTGEIAMVFDSADSGYTVDFIAFGD